MNLSISKVYFITVQLLLLLILDLLINQNMIEPKNDSATVCENGSNKSRTEDAKAQQQPATIIHNSTEGESGNYWRLRYERLLNDYNHLQKINQNLEDRLLTIVESFERKKEELMANTEYEKSTLMADVNKLSTKLVDARIKLHDYEEKELLHASECDAPCHKNCTDSGNKNNGLNGTRDQVSMHNDPNLV